MSDCWDVLDLTPPVERRDVKRAYARLLKQNRPDDDPVAFEQLHAAYQTALWYVENDITPQVVEQESPMPATPEDTLQPVIMRDADDAQPTNVDTTNRYNADPLDSAVLAQQRAAEAAFAEEEAERVAHVDEMMRKVYALLANEQRLHNPDAWRPLADDPALIDDRLRIRFGAELGTAIADHQREAWKNKASRYSQIPASVASLLDSAVLWTLRPEDYYNDLSYDDWTVLDNLTGEEERRELPAAMGGETQEEIAEWAKSSRVKEGGGWSGPSKFLLFLVIAGLLRLCSIQSDRDTGSLDPEDITFTKSLVGAVWRGSNGGNLWQTPLRDGSRAEIDIDLSSVTVVNDDHRNAVVLVEQFLTEQMAELVVVRDDAELVAEEFAGRSDRELLAWLGSAAADDTLARLDRLALAHYSLSTDYRRAVSELSLRMSAAQLDATLRRTIAAMLRKTFDQHPGSWLRLMRDDANALKQYAQYVRSQQVTFGIGMEDITQTEEYARLLDAMRGICSSDDCVLAPVDLVGDGS